jgi:hypothetical protein
MEIASGVVARLLCCDEGREVHLIEALSDDGSNVALAMKYWDPDRLAGGGMTDQVSSCRLLHKAADTRSLVSPIDSEPAGQQSSRDPQCAAVQQSS